jgi:serine/alanine adding enzyme
VGIRTTAAPRAPFETPGVVAHPAQRRMGEEWCYVTISSEQLHRAVERLEAVGGRPLGAALSEGSARSDTIRRPSRGRTDVPVPRQRTRRQSPDQRSESAQSSLIDTQSVTVVKARHWDAVVRRLGGDAAYHSLGYHRASAALEPASTMPLLLLHRGKRAETALPILLRPLPSGRGWDATTPYGYGGPLSTAPVEDSDFAAAIDEWAAQNGLLASFIRYHPLLANQTYGPGVADVSQLGSTVAWRLDSGPDLLRGMHPHHRRAVRKADRAGVEVRVTRAPRDLGVFRELYESTMQRQHADRFYYFPDAYWEGLTRECHRHLLLVDGLVGDDPVASILCMTGGPYLHYHLGASTTEGRRIGASNRLFLEAATWARSNGLSQFHLGGGLGGSTDSSLYTFKQRFDPESEPKPFYVAKWVHDPAMYTLLAGSRSTDGYFPPWRR